MPAVPDALDFYLATERMCPFAWGRDNGDCLLFLLGWAERCGRRASVDWRGSYQDEAGARAALDSFGGAIAAVVDVLGPPIMGGATARGDVGLLSTDGWHLGMIATGGKWTMRAGTRGVRLVSRPPDIAWRLGVPDA